MLFHMEFPAASATPSRDLYINTGRKKGNALDKPLKKVAVDGSQKKLVWKCDGGVKNLFKV